MGTCERDTRRDARTARRKSTYFEGVADAAIAKRGYSRDHRPDCVQVNIALVVTREGMPLGYEIFPGNTRIDTALASLERRIQKSKQPLDRGVIERQIGRLLERNSRAAGGFSIAITADDSHPSGLRKTRTYRPEWATWARITEGVYILRTNITDWTDAALWQTYIQLTEAEAAFRVHKSDLALQCLNVVATSKPMLLIMQKTDPPTLEVGLVVGI